MTETLIEGLGQNETTTIIEVGEQSFQRQVRERKAEMTFWEKVKGTYYFIMFMLLSPQKTFDALLQSE